MQDTSIINANVQSEMRADERRNLRLLTVEAREHAIQDMLLKVVDLTFAFLTPRRALLPTCLSHLALVVSIFLSLSQRESEKEIRREEEAQEIRIAEEMQRLKIEKQRDAKLRQQMRENRFRTILADEIRSCMSRILSHLLVAFTF